MSYIGHSCIKRNILLVFVSFWIMGGAVTAQAAPSEVYLQAEKLQKEPNGAQKAIDYLWKNSEKLQRPELLQLAKLLVKKNQFKDILKVSDIALAKNPQDPEFLTFQGKAYMETGQNKKNNDKAQESLRAAIDADPKFEPAYLILDDFYERQDALFQKLKKPLRFLQTRRLLFEDLIKNVGDKALYEAKLCEINSLDGVNDQATKNCLKAIELNKSDMMSRLNLAQVYKQTGEKKKSLEVLQKAVLDNPSSLEVRNAFGSQLEEDKNYGDAYQHFKACLEKNPEYPPCLRGLGATAASLKKWDESYSAFQKLCRKGRRWSLDVRKAAATAQELGELGWQQKLLELSINCNI